MPVAEWGIFQRRPYLNVARWVCINKEIAGVAPPKKKERVETMEIGDLGPSADRCRTDTAEGGPISADF